MRGLYAIVDLETLARRDLDPVRFARSIIEARPAAIQVRAKAAGARATLDLLRALHPLASRAGVPLFANDRPDLALLAGADGVHVGQDDLPVALARGLATAIGSTLRVGLSTHNDPQVESAIHAVDLELPDYIAVGPVFATTSKDRPAGTVGVDRLAALSARIRAVRPGLPIVAIGGMSLERAREVSTIVDAVAVIQALVPEAAGDHAYEEVHHRAMALHAAIVGGAS